MKAQAAGSEGSNSTPMPRTVQREMALASPFRRTATAADRDRPRRTLTGQRDRAIRCRPYLDHCPPVSTAARRDPTRPIGRPKEKTREWANQPRAPGSEPRIPSWKLRPAVGMASAATAATTQKAVAMGRQSSQLAPPVAPEDRQEGRPSGLGQGLHVR